MIAQTSVIESLRAMQTCELGLTDTVNGIFKVYIIVINIQWGFIEALSAEEVADFHWILIISKMICLKDYIFSQIVAFLVFRYIVVIKMLGFLNCILY